MKFSDRAEAFSREIWEWFARWKRELPWRDVTEKDASHRAYLVLVSEVMLQQTQVSRVMVIFKRFLETFPTLAALARAGNKDVIVAWKGMGYNSRALRLRDAAKEILETHGGVFPQDYEQLVAIKGIGPYTAGAIRNFAFGLPTPCIDTNIYRILHRVFLGPEPEKADGKTQKAVLGLAGETLKIALDLESKHDHTTAGKKISRSRALPGWSSSLKGKGFGQGGNRQGVPLAAEWHAALMDFGSLVCKKSHPKCESCPMAKGICKSAFRIQTIKRKSASDASLAQAATEPGRMIAGRFVPNRIIRGRIVDFLREEQAGPLEMIGRNVCVDWEKEHHAWLQGILDKLVKDGLLMRRGKNYSLME